MTTIAYIDTSTALGAGVSEGFTPDPDGAIYDRLCSSLKWGEREPLETNEDALQVVPYTLVWRPGEVFLTQRLEGGSEERLHGQVSAGIGGHVEKKDHVSALGATYPTHEVEAVEFAAWREVHEEIDAEGYRQQECGCMDLVPHGFIYDTSSAVSRVHLGVVYTLRVDDCEVRETEVLRGMWAKYAHMVNSLYVRTLDGENINPDQLESWAQIALEHLDDLIGDYAAAGE